MVRQNQGNYTLFQHIWCHFSDLTWLEQHYLSPCEAEAKHSRSPTWWNLTQWKLNTKKTQCSGSNKKPSRLETRIAQKHWAESSRSWVPDSRRPPVKKPWTTGQNPERDCQKILWLILRKSGTLMEAALSLMEKEEPGMQQSPILRPRG